ncbi:MAG TPA: ABC transporter permease, partial [Catenuloplanes sp.]
MTGWGAAAVVRPPRARHLVRLKLRVLANGFRGRGWRIALFILGAVFGLWCALGGFFLFAIPAAADSVPIARVVAAFGGSLLVLGWLFLPLVFFGVDETLDPARFALLPLPRRTLVAGMFGAALVGVAPLAMLIATSGLVLSAADLGGGAAVAAAAVGVVAGLLLCVALSRAVTSAFATMLRSRRTRDLAAMLLALFAALIGPLQVALVAAAPGTDWHRLVPVARVLSWTPLAAPYTLGNDVIEGRGWAVPVKLLIIFATIAGLLWWWLRSLESAMVGASSDGTARASRGAQGAPVSQLMPRTMPWLRPGPFGALVAR